MQNLEQSSFLDFISENMADQAEQQLLDKALKLKSKYKDLKITRLQRELRLPYGQAMEILKKIKNINSEL